MEQAKQLEKEVTVRAAHAHCVFELGFCVYLSISTRASQAQIERRAKRLRDLAASVPPEPAADAKHICTLAMRWPDGRSISRRFDANEKLSTVKAFCEAQDRLPANATLCLVGSTAHTRLFRSHPRFCCFYYNNNVVFSIETRICINQVASFPRRVLQDDDRTLSELKLTPNAVLLVDVE